MKRKLFICLLMGCFSFNTASSANKDNQSHYDKADIGYRTYASNFKDCALAICLNIAFSKHDSILEEDVNATTGALMERWIDFDADTYLDKTLKKLPSLIDKYLKQPYGSQFYPNSNLSILKCMDFYHSDDLNKLTEEFVVHPNRTYKQDHPKYPNE